MNLWDYLCKYAQKDSTCIINEGQYYTYKDIVQLIRKIHSSFHRKGIENGDKVILCYMDQFDFAVLFLALITYGCWIIPISVDDSVDVIKEETDSDIVEVLNRLDDLELDDSLNEYIQSGSNGGIYHRTSGSTGKPKYAVRTEGALIAEGIGFMQMFALEEGERILSIAPLYHSFALGSALITSIITGSAIVTFHKLNFHKISKLIVSEAVSVLCAVPALIRLLVRTTKTEQESILKYAIVGAGNVDGETDNLFKRIYGIHCSCNYGSTELGGVISRISDKPAGSIGKTHPGVQYKLIQENTDNLWEGELYIKNKGMMSGYLKDKNTFDAEGFFATGDIVKLDDNGYFYIIGRKKLIANIGGEKVNLLEIEKALCAWDEIEDCAAVFRKKENGEEEIIVFIVSNIEVSDVDIRKICQEAVGKNALPRRICRVDSIPKNSYGKVLRKSLQDYVDTLMDIGS